jgi:lipid A 3-O-deacylase
MKIKLLLFVLVAATAVAQSSSDDPISALRREHWNFGAWADYGNGLGSRDGVHIGGAGLRIGRVMTGEHGDGWRRGTFELDADITPLEVYHFPSEKDFGMIIPAQNYYTSGFTPVILKWNFTSGKRWVPYAEAQAGLVFSTKDLPPTDTAQVNFTPGAAVGLHHFVGKNAWTFQGAIYHLSNASIGPHNPGINAAIQFRVGYTWFKRR